MKNNIKYKLINHTSKKEVKTSNNRVLIRIKPEVLLKNWKKTGKKKKKRVKKSKNMAIFSPQNLYSPVISRNHFSKIKKIKIP